MSSLVFLQLTEKVTFSVVDNERIILYEEHDYAPNVLDIFYATVNVHHPDRAIVLISPRLAEQRYKDSVLFGEFLSDNKITYAQFNVDELTTINQLLNSMGIQDIVYFDKMSLLPNLVEDKACTVTYMHGNYYLVFIDNGQVVDYTFCSYDNLIASGALFCKKHSVEHCSIMDTSYYKDALLYFYNGDLISGISVKNSLTFLSLILQDTSLHGLTIQELVKTMCSDVQQVRIKDLSNSDINSNENEDFKGSESQSIEKESRKAKPKRKNQDKKATAVDDLSEAKQPLKKGLNKVLIGVLVLLCIAIAIFFVLQKRNSSSIIQDPVNQISSTVNEKPQYDAVLNNEDGKDLLSTFKNTKVYSENINSLQSLQIEENVCSVVVSFSEESKGKEFLQEMQNSFKVIDATVNGKDALEETATEKVIDSTESTIPEIASEISTEQGSFVYAIKFSKTS